MTEAHLTLSATRPANTWTEVRNSPLGPLSFLGLATTQFGKESRFLSMCYHPCCASGVRCAALLRTGGGGRRTLHCFSPSRDHWASPPGKCKKSPRGALTLEMCQPVCAFVDSKHCLQTCFLLCKMRIQTLPGIFFCALQTG